jgi:hypothetical protein
MRTTLTLDPDVAAQLQRLRKSREASLKDLVNEALRHGLKAMQGPGRTRKPYSTRSADLGPCLVGNVDNIAEALAAAELSWHNPLSE